MNAIVKEYLDKVVIRDGQKWIDDDVDLYGLGLTELNFYDIYINGHFHCYNNQLMTLEGSPKMVNGSFYCSGNKLTTLKGAPKIILGDFSCCSNFLKNLEYFPERVGGDCYLYHLNCKSLKGIGEIGGIISLDRTFDCDYFLQYSLMGKIRVV